MGGLAFRKTGAASPGHLARKWYERELCSNLAPEPRLGRLCDTQEQVCCLEHCLLDFVFGFTVLAELAERFTSGEIGVMKTGEFSCTVLLM